MATSTMRRIALTLVAHAAAVGLAHADDQATTAAPPPRPPVPDASLRAVADRVVRLELDDGSTVEGRLLGFEEATVTVARAPTAEVVSIARARLARLFLVELPPPADATPGAAPRATRPARLRVLGLHVSPLGTVAVDGEYRRVRALAATSLTLPILTASGGDTWWSAAFGAGYGVPLGGSRWRFDALAGVMPMRTTSHYTYLGVGLAGGFHYTGRSGFSVGFTFPVLGFATRLGSSPTGYDPPFRYNDSLQYYYLAASAGLPLFTLGYRFETKRLR